MTPVLWVRPRTGASRSDLPALAIRYRDEDSLDFIARAVAECFLGWRVLTEEEEDDAEHDGVELGPDIMGADGPVALKLGHYVLLWQGYWQVLDPATFNAHWRVVEDLSATMQLRLQRREQSRRSA